MLDNYETSLVSAVVAARGWRRRALSLAVAPCAVVAASLFPLAAHAQEGQSPSASPAAEGPESEIVVTASRIQRNGFQAATPVTVIGAEDLEKRGLTNVGDLLNQSPAFRPSQSPAANTSTSTGAGFSFADLRGLGSQRTLVLVDGRRHVPSATTGQVDLNLVPAIMIDRAEVVTGGASAAWGSDAVAGVVNLILKRRLEGVQADISGSISRYGDNKELRAGLAAGTAFADGKGHVVAGFEYVDNTGVGDSTQRPWTNLDYGIATNSTPGTNGFPARIIGPNFYQSQLTGGGIILNAASNPASLRGLTFLPNGTTTPFQFGQTFGSGMFGPGTSGLTQQTGVIWKVPVKCYSGLLNLDYDFSDAVSGFAQFGYAHSQSTNLNGYPRDTSITVKIDNPFLPASVKTAMQTANVQQITIGRYDIDLPIVEPTAKSTTVRGVAGLSGKISDKWNWKAYYQYGRNHFHVDIRHNRINPNWNAAIDAVRDGNGNIVCRNPNLVTGGIAAAAGCVPFNIFGQGAASPAAMAYVIGDGFGDTVVQQHVAALDITGEPFSTWAGPVSVAFGGEYRKELAETTSDALSAGLAFNIGNPRPIKGSYNVKEIYGEVVVPLAKDLPGLRSLELNAAGRRSDYSLSGAVNTWKVGLTWEPIDGVRLRGTRSRDVRAPNITELFSLGTFSRPLVTNPWNSNLSTNTPVNTGIGNAALKPEKADTTTFGVVVQPRGIPGLAFSVDYYNIKMRDVVTTLGTQNLVNRCFAGATEFCQFVIGAGTNSITLVNNANLNLNGLRTRGEDIELSYRTSLRPLSLPGEVSLRVLATHVDELTTIDSVSAINRAGQLSQSNGTVGVPKWTIDGQLSYTTGPFTLTTAVHYFNSGKYDVTMVGPEDPGYSPSLANSINTNRVAGAAYVRIGAQYDLIRSDSRTVQLYGTISNLFDRDPSASPTGATSFNGVLYDPVGRTFTLGVRVKA